MSIPFTYFSEFQNAEYLFGRVIEPISPDITPELIDSQFSLISRTILDNSSEEKIDSSTMVAKSDDNFMYLSFVLYSGATDHLVNSTFGLHNIRELTNNSNVQGAEKSSIMKPKLVGDLHIVARNRENVFNEIKLRNVMYVPTLSCNLLSEDCITKSGAEIRFTSNFAEVYEPDSNRYSVFVAERIDRAKRLQGIILNVDYSFNNGSNNQNFAFSVIKRIECSVVPNRKELFNLWHRRLGHISAKYLKMLSQVTDGVPE